MLASLTLLTTIVISFNKEENQFKYASLWNDSVLDSELEHEPRDIPRLSSKHLRQDTFMSDRSMSSLTSVGELESEMKRWKFMKLHQSRQQVLHKHQQLIQSQHPTSVFKC